MPPQSKRKKAPESPSKAGNKKSKQAEAPAPLEDPPQDGNRTLPGPRDSPDDPTSKISEMVACLQTVLQSLRDECITKSPYFRRAPDLPVLDPGIGSRMRKRMDELDAEDPDDWQKMVDDLEKFDEANPLSPPSPRTVDTKLRRMGMKIPEEVVVPNVWGLAGAFVGNPHLIDRLGRVCHLEKDLAELKESTGREKQALFDELVEVALAKERATHGNNQSDGK